MKRLILIVLLVGLAALLIPGVRHRIQPRIDASREWLGIRLERPLAPVLTPYRRVKTQSLMGKAVNSLVNRRNMGYDPPQPDEFRDYLVDRELIEDGVDAWGAPFLLEQRPDSLRIISAGPDIEYHTEDDIVETIRYKAPDRRRPRSFRR